MSDTSRPFSDTQVWERRRAAVTRLAAQVLARLPAYPGSLLLVEALNLLLARHLPSDTRTLLEGRKLRLCVHDLQLRFDFQWTSTHFAACRHEGELDLTIGAASHDLMLLLRRMEDPDTLFFNRRLQLEGDTELGLLVKNTLDAMEIELLDPRRLSPLNAWMLLKRRVAAGIGLQV